MTTITRWSDVPKKKEYQEVDSVHLILDTPALKSAFNQAMRDLGKRGNEVARMIVVDGLVGKGMLSYADAYPRNEQAQGGVQ